MCLVIGAIWSTSGSGYRKQGVALILAVSAQMHGERAKESEVVVDSTVQEKNVTYPLETTSRIRWSVRV
jgi:hypothetical protein